MEEFYRNGIIPIRDWDLFWYNLELRLEKQREIIANNISIELHRNFSRQSKKRQRCGICLECTKPNCGTCINCLDKLEYNTRKQRCKKIGVCLAWK